MQKRVLVVDDSETVRKILGTALADAGYDVTEAVDGEEALEQASLVTFDLLMTDLKMPKMDGIELVREFRRIEGCRFTPTIMLTSDRSDERQREGRGLGVNGWLHKPFEPEQLLKIIKLITPKH